METTYLSGITFQLDLTKPLYEQILLQIRHAIARGELEQGSKLPSVRELAQHLKINPNTVMRAYQELERDGLSETRRGQGTFVTSSIDKIMAIRDFLAQEAMEAFIQAMQKLGIKHQQAIKMLEEAKW